VRGVERNKTRKGNKMNAVVKAIESKEARNAKVSKLAEARKAILNMTSTIASHRALDANTEALVMTTGFDRYQVKAIYG
jgi:hypothetical protein